MHFTKYHGTGNDFIMIDSRKNVITDRSVKRISALCDRHFGIGADGLIILDESKEHDFRMSYFNADGHPGTMCGNGGRCTTAFAKQQGWIINNCHFEAADGLHSGSLHKDGSITISLNDVSKTDTIQLEKSTLKTLENALKDKGLPGIPMDRDKGTTDIGKIVGATSYFIHTGSPHLIVFVKGLDTLDVYNLGRELRYDPRFPGGTNVNFVQQTADGIKVRTFERGVENETLSCGTGVTASAIASSMYYDAIHSPVNIETLGGRLEVSFVRHAASNKITDITLTGMVRRVFDGKWEGE